MVDLISICCLLAWSGCFADVRDCAARGFALFGKIPLGWVAGVRRIA